MTSTLPKARLFKAESFLIDGEAIVCGPDGLSDFDALVLDGERMK
jgi:ATP-dependent DNA ligase